MTRLERIRAYTEDPKRFWANTTNWDVAWLLEMVDILQAVIVNHTDGIDSCTSYGCSGEATKALARLEEPDA